MVTGGPIGPYRLTPHPQQALSSFRLPPAWSLGRPLVTLEQRISQTMRFKRLVVSLMAVTAVAFAIVPAAVSAHQRHQRNHRDSRHDSHASVPRYRHIVEIMMENTSYGSIIGNSLAPNINAMANQYGLATNYFGVTTPASPTTWPTSAARTSASRTTTSSTAPRRSRRRP